MARALTLVVLFALASCAAPIGDEGEEVGAATEAVTCDPHILRYPIAAPYNGGYDPSWNDFRCDGARNNSDYGGDHHGNDLFAERGAPVVSPVDGVISRAGVVSASSVMRVTVQDACGWSYYHGHLDTIAPDIHEGMTVRVGHVLGTVGNTGATGTAPHVHFNVHRDRDFNDDIDPFPLLQPVAATACGPDPMCAGRGEGAFCTDATHRAVCTGGRFEVGDCAFFGTTCDMDTGVGRCTPHLDGVFLGSTFPGGTRIEVPLGGEVTGCLTYRNTGSWTWDAETRLGTTEPRDRPSEHAASSWLGASRLASAGAATARGAEAQFCFALHAAATPGERRESFSIVQELRFWAADVGGVADTVNYLTVVTVDAPAAPLPPPPGPGPGLGDDAEVPAAGEDGGTGAPPPSMGSRPGAVVGGCAVAAPTGSTAPLGASLLVVLALARSRRRLRDTRAL